MEPDERALRSRITSTGSANKAGDVPQNLRAFRATVWRYYKANGRHDLPWRKTTDPYSILVSEVMLQQTQVSRVIEKYKSFLKKFPTVRALAKAPLSEVLKEWSGLGYNRRGKYLHDAAKEIVGRHRGDFKEALSRPLPGVGPYTKAAVRVFAFDEPDVLIETNIRAVYLQYFFECGIYEVPYGLVHDKDIVPVAQSAAEKQDPREWHWALMDYGAHLKKTGVRNNQRSARYTRQSKFEGSLRQARGAILHRLVQGLPLDKKLSAGKEMLEKALDSLERDGLIVQIKGPVRSGSALGRKWRIS